MWGPLPRPQLCLGAHETGSVSSSMLSSYPTHSPCWGRTGRRARSCVAWTSPAWGCFSWVPAPLPAARRVAACLHFPETEGTCRASVRLPGHSPDPLWAWVWYTMTMLVPHGGPAPLLLDNESLQPLIDPRSGLPSLVCRGRQRLGLQGNSPQTEAMPRFVLCCVKHSRHQGVRAPAKKCVVSGADESRDWLQGGFAKLGFKSKVFAAALCLCMDIGLAGWEEAGRGTW